ncbi:MAG TPA: spore cortex-lytic enzyme [Symbiobacteriaceae bacterium]|jgi:N-acetylmuramoyl-L-alanine amidase|nr:spore cortex-lytic enzyme [Symbiobacteriaceae bacterium]
MRRRIVAGLLLLVLLVFAMPWTAYAQQPTLRWGSRGASVTLAQRRLRAWGYYHGAIDGVYGRKMYGAIITFQRKNGLRADGVVGSSTWAALGYSGRAPAGGGGGTRAASRTDDARLLAMVISAEARGEPYEGQVAVGAVLLNRVRDSRFPGTLAGVVYQKHAFESVSNGSIYQTPAASATRAARDALNGWDPTHGAVFFWNPSKPVSGWIWSRPIIKRIGNHVFAK